ncbi:unnamed protein product [Mycena citricolor]|uniref:ARM repeat-containing protein n=1 Tax=Mycena citricolor TaxID=2018698 RepID=A0AAD2HLQ0_9AGAR|nr:unnamed protein product [Mycena citricolor]
MFEQELLQHVVIGMGRLDLDDDVEMSEGDVIPEAVWPAEEQTVHVANAEDEPTPQVTSFKSPKAPGASPVSSYFPPAVTCAVPSPASSNSSTPNSSNSSSDTSSSASSPGMLLHADPNRSSTEILPSLPPFDEDGALDEGEGDQAAVGRLSSMSLMAAVTANGDLDDNTKHAFVREVERVGHDPVYWVRREASYALGALAKVVPEEVVLLSLMPLFETLRRDSQWHVRHSALFALPAILSRLHPGQRRKLALESVLPLSTDESQTVRSGALECLGEVIYTFHADPGGPPKELVELFLGRREDKRVRDGQQATEERERYIQSLLGRANPTLPVRPESPLTSFFTDSARPLICAFNMPAVALTLGGARWPELRQTYLDISENRDPSIRRTLAASLAEMAKIIGPEHAEVDLLGVWWDSVVADDEEIRERALGITEAFVPMMGRDNRAAMVRGLLDGWQAGSFRGWRERKSISKSLAGLASAVGDEMPEVLRALLMKALQDDIAAVREAAISIVRYFPVILSSSLIFHHSFLVCGVRSGARICNRISGLFPKPKCTAKE